MHAMTISTGEHGFVKNSTKICCIALLAILLPWQQVSAAELNVRLVDHLNQQPLAGMKITALQRQADGKLGWVTRKTTSASGQLTFDLPELDTGTEYVLRLNGNGWSKHQQTVTTSGNLGWSVGQLAVTLIDGNSEQAMANTSAQVLEQLPDGKTRWLSSGRTDANGQLRIPRAGQTLIISARSPVDNKGKHSTAINSDGAHNVIIGNKPLTVAVVDAISGTAIANQRIVLRELLADGSYGRLYYRLTTDNNGQAVFVVPGLGTDGKRYQASVAPFGTGNIRSAAITSVGQFEFSAGNLGVTIVDGATSQPMANTRVQAWRQAGNNWQSAGSATTDANGLLRWHLPNLGDGTRYSLGVKNSVDGKMRYQMAPESLQTSELVFGEQPLRVQVVDAINQQGLNNVRINIREVLADGSLKWFGARRTDADGNAQLALEGLTENRRYQLDMRPFGSSETRSAIISSAETPLTFAVGNIRVNASHGVSGAALSNQRIDVYSLDGNNAKRWVTGGRTDNTGALRLDVANPDPALRYIMRSRSPVDNSNKWGPELSNAPTFTGNYDFAIGNPPLNVQLLDAINSQVLANQKVVIFRRAEDGSLQWVRRPTTNDQGRFSVDLDGLESGTRYVLRASAFNGGSAYSPDVTAAGDFVFAVGNAAITLRSDEDHQIISGQNVTVYQKQSDGRLKWRRSGTTDTTGQIRFHLNEVDNGGIYVLRTHNPFGNSQSYYSDFITSAGEHEFLLNPDDPNKPDRRPPTLTIVGPDTGAQVASTGFRLYGTVRDNESVQSLVVNVVDAQQGIYQTDATIAGNDWHVDIPASALSAEATATISVTAEDDSHNQSTASTQVAVIADAAAPLLAVDSHANDDQVPRTGFLLNGSASDDTGIDQLLVTLVDSQLGTTLDEQEVEVSANGRFSLAVFQGDIAEGSTVQINLQVTDVVGQTQTASLSLRVQTDHDLVRHLLNRATFGANHTLINTVQANGIDSWLEQQLLPANVDDSALQARLAGWNVENRNDLQRYQLLHAIYSARQLNEVLAVFWENHFNTFLNHPAISVAMERAENDAFRAEALGNFRQLLEISATSPTMLFYLDSVSNLASDSNENYSREIKELHTMGVDNGYTQADVEAGAEIFTGWQVQNGQFFFNAAQHNGAEDKLYLGHVIPAGGVDEGMQALDILAAHPSTASYLCDKLVVLLVDDVAPASLVERCASTFNAQTQAPDQIAQVVRLILTSPEFNQPVRYRNKIKTPLELVASTLRLLQVDSTATDLPQHMRNMSMSLFEYPVPTGFSEVGSDWLNSNLLIQRMRFVNTLVRNPAIANRSAADLPTYFSTQGFETADGVIGHLLNLTSAEEQTAVEWAELHSLLLNADGEFDINTATGQSRLRQTVGAALSLPAFQYQ